MNRRYITYLSCIVLMVYAMVITVISPLIMEIADTFNLTISNAGVIFTFTFIGLTCFVPVGGYIADRTNKKHVLNFSVVGLTLSLFAFVFCPNFFCLCLVSIFIGGFGGVLESMIGAFVQDINHERPEYYVNMSQIFFGLGAIIGPLAAGSAINQGMGWRYCYIFLGILLVIVSAIFLSSPYKEKPLISSNEDVGNGTLKITDLLKNKVFILLCICMFAYTGSEVGAWGWMCTYLEESFSFNSSQSSSAVALFWSALTLGRIFCGYLTSRFSTVKIITYLAFGSAIFTFFSAFVKSGGFVYITVIAMGLSFSSQYPLILSYAGKVMKKSTGTIFSLLTACSGIGNMIVPYFMGILGDSFHMRTAMILPAALFCLTGIIFLFSCPDSN